MVLAVASLHCAMYCLTECLVLEEKSVTLSLLMNYENKSAFGPSINK